MLSPPRGMRVGRSRSDQQECLVGRAHIGAVASRPSFRRSSSYGVARGRSARLIRRFAPHPCLLPLRRPRVAAPTIMNESSKGEVMCAKRWVAAKGAVSTMAARLSACAAGSVRWRLRAAIQGSSRILQGSSKASAAATGWRADLLAARRPLLCHPP